MTPLPFWLIHDLQMLKMQSMKGMEFQKKKHDDDKCSQDNTSIH